MSRTLGVTPTPAQYSVITTRRSGLTHVSSLASENDRGAERVILSAEKPISDYTTYFKAGRFYLVIANARVDLFQELRGQIFSDPVIERRGEDLVVSLALLPGTKVRVGERPTGLEILLIPGSTN